MTKTFGDKPIGDKSTRPGVGAKSDYDLVQPDPTLKSKPPVLNPTGKPTRFLKKRPGQ